MTSCHTACSLTVIHIHTHTVCLLTSLSYIIHLTIAITSPRKNDLCTRLKDRPGTKVIRCSDVTITSQKIGARARPRKSGDVINLKYTDICGVFYRILN